MIVPSHLVTVVPGKLQQMDYIHKTNTYTPCTCTHPYHATAVYKCSVPSSSGSQQPLRPMRIQSHRRHSLPDLESRETGRVPNSRHRRPSSTFLLLTTIVTYRTQTLPGPVRSSWKPPRLPVSQRGGRGRPSQNAASGCRFPNRRIQRSVALSDMHAPRATFLFIPVSYHTWFLIRVWETYGHGLAERGGDAESKEVPRGVIQRWHGQRAVRGQLGRFFLSGVRTSRRHRQRMPWPPAR